MKKILILLLFLVNKNENCIAKNLHQGVVNSSYTYRQFTLQDGLPSIQITYLIQDSNGFLWIGTKGGVCRWDGRNLVSFATNPAFKKQVTSIVELKNGTICILYGAMHYYASIHGNNIKLHTLTDEYKNYQIENILDDKYFDLILRLAPIQYYTGNEKIKVIGLKNEKSYLQYESPVTNHGFLYFNHDTIVSINYNFERKYSDLYLVLKGKIIDSIRVDNTIQYYYFIHRNSSSIKCGIFSLDANNVLDVIIPYIENQKIKYSRKTISMNWTFKNEHIFNLDDKSNFIIFGNKLIQIYDTKNNVVKLNNLPKSTCGIIDKNGICWLGTEQGLLCYYRFGVKQYKYNFREGEYDDIWSMAKDANGQFVLSSYYKGFFRTNNNNSTWESLNNKISVTSKINIDGILKGSFGTITSNDGVTLLPHDLGFALLRNNQILKFEYPACGEIYGSAVDSLQRILYVLNYQNLFKVNTKNLSIEKMATAKELGLQNFIHMTIDNERNPIVSGNSKILKWKDQKWITLSDSFYARMTCVDYMNTLWCANKKDQVFNFRNQKWGRVNGLPYIDFPMAFTIWKKNWLVIGGAKEVIFLNLKKYYTENKIVFKRIDSNTGLTILEGGQNNFFVDNSDSTLYWCCSDKVIQLYPTKLLHESNVQEVIILSTHAYNVYDILDTLTSHEKDKLIFSKNFRNLVIEFSSPTFEDNEVLKYYFKLSGYDNEWHITSEQSVVYKNLPPGNYKLNVKATVDNVNFTPIAQSENLVVTPYFYETIFFNIVLLICFICFVVLVTYVLLKRKTKQNEEKINKEKETIELKLKTLRAKFTTHFSGNVYNAMVYLIEQKKYDEAINYLLKFSKLNADVISNVDKASRCLKEELKLVNDYLLLEKLRYSEKLNYTINVDNTVNQDIEVPQMLLHTFAENAIKHGLMSEKGYGYLNIHIFSKDSNGITILIEDDGIGREKAKLYNLDSTRIGLSTLEKQISLYNLNNIQKITLEIFDKIEKGVAIGTKIIIFIPFNYTY